MNTEKRVRIARLEKEIEDLWYELDFTCCHECDHWRATCPKESCHVANYYFRKIEVKESLISSYYR